MKFFNTIKFLVRESKNPMFKKVYKLIHKIYKKITLLYYFQYSKIYKNKANVRKNRNKNERYLEIGPGTNRIVGFETLDIVGGKDIDYVLDASKRLPFDDNSFDIIYASHILEHIPWYQVETTFKDWVRTLKPGGKLEVLVPNGLKICTLLLDFEKTGKDLTYLDGWYRLNPEKSPYLWAAGRIFTYGDGDGNLNSPNWHRSVFTPKYLLIIFEKSGLINIRELSVDEVRGYDHGWINLGITGSKK